MNRTLQIDVKGPTAVNGQIMECRLYIDGRCCAFYISKANYEALMFDRVFIRDGRSEDSAGVINTTNVFKEE